MSRIRSSQASAMLAAAGLAAAGGLLVPKIAGARSEGSQQRSAAATRAESEHHRARGPHALRLAQEAMHAGRPRGEGRPAASAAERLERRTDRFGEIGEELGTDAAHVTAAVRGAIAGVLDDDVHAGRLTAGQAESILTAWDAAAHPPASARPSADTPRRARPSRAAHRREVQAFRADVAKSLGVTTSKLVAAIREVAEEYGGGGRS